MYIYIYMYVYTHTLCIYIYIYTHIVCIMRMLYTFSFLTPAKPTAYVVTVEPTRAKILCIIVYHIIL